MSLLPFFPTGFDPFPEGLSLPFSWFSGQWPWLLLLALAGLSVTFTLIRSWSWLLDWEAGRWWPVPASILPALIPIARSLEKMAPAWVARLTLALLLMTVAVLQTYGQDRNNRDRIKTEDRFTEQTNLLIASINEAREAREQAARAEALIADLINETGEARSESERQAARTEALLCRIADGITTAAAAAEEARGEHEC